MKIGDLETHPYADAFPLLAGVEFDRFRDDIKDRGLLTRELHRYQGKLLDGRNRYRACIELGLEPVFIDHDDEDPLRLVLSLNHFRRHQNESQRALSASKLASLKPGRPKKGATNSGLSVAAAAAVMNVGESTVREAKFVLEQTTEAVVAAVECGDISLAAARELAELELVDQDAALQRVLEHDSKKARGTAARSQKRIANDEQPDAQQVLVRAIGRAVTALGGTIRSLKQGNLEVALHGQVLGVHVQLQERAA